MITPAAGLPSSQHFPSASVRQWFCDLRLSQRHHNEALDQCRPAAEHPHLRQQERLMNFKTAVWLMARGLRWLATAAFLAVAYYIYAYRSQALDSFGQLRFPVEASIFITGLAIVFLGLFEMMAREQAGFPRPRFGQILPQKQPAKAP
jgi:hypothetical protein